MAVTYVNDIDASDITGADATFVFASVPGSTGDIVVAAFAWGNNPAVTVSSVVYGASAMTLIESGAADIRGGALYYLVNPAGTENITVTFSGTYAGAHGSAIIASGANTADPIQDTDEAILSGQTSSSRALVADTDALGIDVFFKQGTGDTITPSGDVRGSFSSGAISYQPRMQTQAGGASFNMTYSWTSSVDGYHAAVAIRAAAAGGRTTKNVRSHPLGHNLGMGLGMPTSSRRREAFARRQSGIYVPGGYAA